MPALRFIAVLFLLTFLSANFQSASAQRYLTEFVGLSRVNVSRASVALPSSLEFDELVQGRRLGGNFFSLERNGLGASEQELFSLNGVLETSGKCRVQLNALNNRGTLSLFEKNFDTDIFALVGTISVEQDLGAISLSRSGFTGNSGFLRPVLSASAPAHFLTLKAAVTRMPSGALASAKRDYSIVDSRARILDSGIAELSELLPE